MKPIHVGALVLLGAIWGASFLFIRETAHDFGPFVLMFLRVSIAASVLIGYSIALRNLPNLRSHWRTFLIVGAFNTAIPFSLIAFSELTITASLAAILNSTTPLFTAIVAAMWVGEALTGRKILGVLMGVIGVVILTGGSALDMNSTFIIAILASLGASVCYGIGTVYASKHLTGLPSLHAAIGQLIGASTILLIPAGATIPETPPSATAIAFLLALAVMSTSFAYLIYFYLLKNVGPTRTASVTFLVPVFGTVWGIIFLNEPFNLSMLVGMGIILASVGLVIGANYSKRKPTVAAELA